jgi:hypothetical protein
MFVDWISLYIIVNKDNLEHSFCYYTLFQNFAMFWMLDALFWVIPRRLNFIRRRFRTVPSTLSAYEDGTDIVVPKRRHIKFRRRGITQKKACNNFSHYVYFFSLHISGDYVPIIRRNTCTYATLGTCHLSPDSYPFRLTNTKCRINTAISPDDGQLVARNMYRKEKKHTKKNCAPIWLYLQDYKTR